MQVNQNRKKEVIQYVNESKDYTFANFITEHNLGNNALYRASDVVIKCPFHEDEVPSCSMNDTMHAFMCFSCGRHGSYIEFLTMYSNEIEGINTNFYEKLNQLLREDEMMQLSLGYSTIYEESKFEIKDRKPFRAKKGLNLTTTYLELADEMLRRKCTKQQISLAISLMQKEFSVQEISSAVFEEKRELNYDLGKLIGG